MDILSPKPDEQLIIGANGKLYDNYAFEIILSANLVESIFRRRAQFNFDVQALDFPNPVPVLAIEERLKRHLAEEVNTQISKKYLEWDPKIIIKQNLSINLMPFLKQMEGRLPELATFKTAIVWDDENRHEFVLSIYPPPISEFPRQAIKTSGLVTLEPAYKEDKNYLILYGEEQNTIPFLLTVENVLEAQPWINKTRQEWTLTQHPKIEVKGLDDAGVELVRQFFDFEAEPPIVKPLPDPLQHRVIFRTKIVSIPKEEYRFLLIITIESGVNPDRTAQLELQVLLRPKAFNGVVALDFGTTNSACVFVDPTVDRRSIIPRRLMNSQLVQLGATMDEYLLKPVEFEEGKEILRNGIIATAQDTLFHGTLDNFDINSINDIRNFMLLMVERGVEEDQIVRMYTDFLYNLSDYTYRDISQSYPSIAYDFAELYFTCINKIIDIDIQSDYQVFLPELEARSYGEISSAVRLDQLNSNTTERLILHTDIDPYTSTISMGEAIKYEIASTDDEMMDIEGNHIVHNRYLTGLKRNIGLDTLATFIDLQNTVIKDKYDAIVFLALRNILGTVEEKMGSINDIVVTFPANLPQTRKEKMMDLIRACGIRKIDQSFDEATAAALYYVWRELLTDQFAAYDGFLSRSEVLKNKQGLTSKFYQNYLVYDMGGGTTDIALLEICLEEKFYLQRNTGKEGRYFEVKPSILGLAGVNNYGGDNVTLAVFRLLKSKLALAVLEKSKDASNISSATGIDASKGEKLINWVHETDKEKAYREVSEIIEYIIPTKFRQNPKNRAAFFMLWNEAERIKIRLNNEKEYTEEVFAEETELQLTLPEKVRNNLSDLSFSISIKYEELQKLIMKDIMNGFSKARNLSIQDNKCMYEIHKVILSGNSCRLKIVKDLVKSELGYDTSKSLPAIFKYDDRKVIFNSQDAKLAVARGACLPGFLGRIHPGENDDMIQELRQGKYFLPFDVDNIRRYMPFSVAYILGAGADSVIFKIRDELNLERPDEKVFYKRKQIMAGEIEVLHCYRIEDERNDFAKQLYIGTFEIGEAIKIYKSDQQNKKKRGKESVNKKEGELQETDFSVFMEFDSNRILSCFLVPKNIIWNKGNPIDVNLAKILLIKDEITGELSWNKEVTVTADSGATGQDVWENEVSENYTKLNLEKKNILALRDKVQIRVDDKLLWSFYIPPIDLKDQEFSHLEIRFFIDRVNALPKLYFGVAVPDFHLVNEVKLKYDESRDRYSIFNPFEGNE